MVMGLFSSSRMDQGGTNGRGIDLAFAGQDVEGTARPAFGGLIPAASGCPLG
jgi:hypothetical protein